MASKNVSNTFVVSGRSAYLHKRTILKEILLKGLYCFVFLRNESDSRNSFKILRRKTVAAIKIVTLVVHSQFAS